MPGLHAGRNRGLREAKGEVLVYADDDIVANPDWLYSIKETFSSNPEIALVGGNNYPLFKSEQPWWLEYMWFKDKEGNKYLPTLSIIDLGSEQKEINPYFVFGCNFSVSKDVLLKAGGFPPDCMPMDLVLYYGEGENYISRFIKENGYKAIFNPKASVQHLVSSERMTETYFRRWAFTASISDSYTNIRINGAKGLVNSLFIGALKRKLRNFRTFIGDFRRVYRYKLPIKKAWFYLLFSAAVRKSYEKGYFYHQKMVRKHPSLLKWVLQENYLVDKASLPMPVIKNAPEKVWQ